MTEPEGSDRQLIGGLSRRETWSRDSSGPEHPKTTHRQRFDKCGASTLQLPRFNHPRQLGDTCGLGDNTGCVFAKAPASIILLPSGALIWWVGRWLLSRSPLTNGLVPSIYHSIGDWAARWSVPVCHF